MAFAPLRGGFRFPFMSRPRLAAHRAFTAARDFSVHLVERARNVFGDVRDLDVAEYVFELCGDAVAAGNRFAERDGLADHPKISATRSAILQILRRLSTALGTVHDRSPLHGALSGCFCREQSNFYYARWLLVVQTK